jgi:hypothetical protein
MIAVSSTLSYLLRWGLYLIRWLLFAVYGTVQFVSKPGSCLIIPALALAAAWYLRQPLDAAIDRYVLDADWQQLPRATLEAMACVGLVLAICVYAAVSPRLLHIRAAMDHGGSVLRFLGRLGLLLAVALAGAYYYQLPIYSKITGYLSAMDLPNPMNVSAPTLPDALLVFGFVLATCAYLALSRLLTLLIGVFPPFVRPLPPMRALQVRNRGVRSVVVRMAVPKLSTPRRTRRVETLLPEGRNENAAVGQCGGPHVTGDGLSQSRVRGGEAGGRNFANISIVYEGRIRGVCLSRGRLRRRLLDQEDLLRH